MIYSVVLLAASAALASAQAVTYNSTTGVFTCPANNPNGAYCADNDGKTNIIIRCSDGIGHPGNCNDNLSGTFPIGLSYSPCYQSSGTAGDAACSKNCVVYGGSGNANGTFPVPGCSPTTTASIATSTSIPATSSSVTSISVTGSAIPTSSASASSTLPTSSASTTITSTVTTTCITDGTTTTQTFTTTYCPSSTLSTVTLPLPTGGSSASPSNGTLPTSVGPIRNGTASPTLSGSATATPVGPKTTASSAPEFTGGALANSAGAGLAAVGLIVAYFL